MDPGVDKTYNIAASYYIEYQVHLEKKHVDLINSEIDSLTPGAQGGTDGERWVDDEANLSPKALLRHGVKSICANRPNHYKESFENLEKLLANYRRDSGTYKLAFKVELETKVNSVLDLLGKSYIERSLIVLYTGQDQTKNHLKTKTHGIEELYKKFRVTKISPVLKVCCENAKKRTTVAPN